MTPGGDKPVRAASGHWSSPYNGDWLRVARSHRVGLVEIEARKPSEDVCLRLLPGLLSSAPDVWRHACDCCQVGESMGRPAAWAASSRRLS
jgi:hypothetical protein